MAEREDSSGGGGRERPDGPAPGGERAAREARLAEQLRANLLRRKQQARQRAADPGRAESGEEAAAAERPARRTQGDHG
ncbi:MAG: hypothetical protein WD100_09815 [Tistlia sp.]|uniref:hypothetical protein n=1 Tax=Tistlia sp. TaxID=3057121 RepID=UPI0034A1001D